MNTDGQNENEIKSECLTEQQINSTIEGDNSAEQDERIAGHLESCDDCRVMLEFVGADPYVEQLKSHLRSSSGQIAGPSRELSRVVGKMSAMNSTPIDGNRGGVKASVGRGSITDVDISPWLEKSEKGIGILGEYILLEKLGQGGMGAVYLADEPKLQRQVALKILLPTLALNSGSRDRFLSEARAAAAVVHPNIVAIHSVVSDTDLPFLVLEFVDGPSLDQAIPKLDFDQQVSVARQIASAVSAAHEKGIIHRDIKPSNILVDLESTTARLTDFGLAKMDSLSHDTQTGIVVGTPGFIAPEILSGESRPNVSSDIYSLGVTFRKMFPNSIVNPEWLESVIEQMTQHNPVRRPNSVEAIGNAFESCTPIVAKRSRGVFNPVGMIVLTIFMIALLAYSITGGWGPGTSRNNNPDSTTKTPQTIVVKSGVELAAALTEAPSGSTIKIDSAVPLVVSETELKQDSLTIASAVDHRAAIRFAPEDPKSKLAMIRINGDLKIQNVDIVFRDGSDDPNSLRNLIQLDGGSLEVENCKWVMGPSGTIVSSINATKIKMTNSRLHTRDGTVLFCHPSAETALVFERSVFTGASTLNLVMLNKTTIRFNHCTVFADSLFSFATEYWTEDTSPAIEVAARQNLFSVSQSLLDFDTDQLSESDFSSAISWDGTGNVFSGSMVATVNSTGQVDIQDWAVFQKGWEAVANENHSLSELQPFLTPNAVLDRKHADQIELADKDLIPAKSISSQINDVGAIRSGK